MYKRKTQKINFVNVKIVDGSKSKINFKWKKLFKSSITSVTVKQLFNVYNSFLISKFSNIKRDSRLTLKCLRKMLFNAKLFFQERNLMMKLFYRQKIVLTWNFNEIDKVKPKIIKDQKIQTVFYKIWQVSNFFVSKTLKSTIIKMLQKQIDVKLLKLCFEFYHNSWFLINKKIKNKYWMINVVMNMNEVIIQNVNLLFNVEKFFEKFTNMRVISLINFFVKETFKIDY